MRSLYAAILISLFVFSGAACGADSSGVKDGTVKKEKAKTVQKASATKPDSAKPKEVKLPKLVDLGAGKCIPCKMMAPILDQMAKDFEGKMEVVVLDVWQNPDEGNKYRIRVIPTQIFFSPEGKELYRHEGFYSREDMLKKWKKLGYDFGR